jgi:ligand-binding sensor domain-containing protein/anti-sigma regulatory factor (Ser/Thr protein kinase)
MLCRLHIPLLIFAIALSVSSFAKSPRYRLETFGTRNGMLSSKVYALAQTSERKLWIGTELGVSVYDGYSFTNYQYTSSNESIGRVLCITQDSSKGVWIGGDKGLFYVHGNNIKKMELQSKTLLVVEALLTDAGGNVWVGDLNALYKITDRQIQQGYKNHTAIINLSPFASFTKRVFSIAEDSRQNIYLGSYEGVFKIIANAGSYQMFWTNPDPYQYVRSVTATSPDSIFWNCLDRHPAQMINGKVTTSFTEDFIGRTVFKKQHNTFALTTSGVGRLQEGIVQPIVSFGNITNNAVTALIDAEENIWVGTWEGLLKFRKTAFQQYALQHNEQKEAFSFLEKKNGDLLFGSNRGIVFTKKQGNIVIDKTIPSLFPLAEVMCMYEDAEGGIWAGSGYQGISRFKNNKFTNWRNTGFLKDNNCEALYPTTDGKLFACTENGVTVIDPQMAQLMTAHYPFQKKYTRPPELFGCFQTQNSGYWFYGSQGLYKLNDQELVDDSLLNMPVKSLYINKIISDKKGNIWVATQGKGLLQCRYENKKLVLYKQYDSRNGLPSDMALSVLVDKNDNVWLGDYMSISVLIKPGTDEQLISFNEKDGLLSAYYQTLKLEQQQNGTIWGLTSMGIVYFHPDSISLNDLTPFLMINSIEVSGDNENYSEKTATTFSYNHNSLQFHYTAVCLTDPSKVRYAYRLKESDSNWTYTNSRIVDFNFLQPGNYTFELKACNNNNVWTSQPLQYNFTIGQPFWQTWWFMLLVISFTGAIVFAIFRARIHTFKAQAIIKQQLAELEAKAIRAQMNPHFIFNSLNAIQETIITEKVDAAYDYLSRFSKLLRMVLDNSEKNLISLNSELETIRLYLSLEALRFSQSFTYSIELEEELDKEDIFIPPLLLQPFVENAIWHGLSNKEGEKKLLLQFEEKDGNLICIIKDNGIGRERAAEIKKNKLGAGRFESKGTKLALQRIEILNRERAGSANIETVDLYDEAGNAAGTKVVVTLATNLKTNNKKSDD